MSRSLDSDLLAHLEADDHNQICKDISALLTNLPENELLEIEFLGKSHPLQPGVNYLRDGTAVAIPKLRLVQAFFVARQFLQAYHKDSRLNSSEVMAATAVLLLMDPEHLTAANTRKRLLISCLENSETGELALRREKQFVDSLLTSRLYRHAKSPTLWSHRRWLLHLFTVHDVVVDLHHDIKNVVMIAGIRHPRNYPAWHHARCLVDRDLELAHSIVADVKEFCLKNHTDISSWSFLVYAINKIENKQDRRIVGSSIFAEVLGITDSLRWISESVWTFLRTIATVGLISDQQFESFVAVNKKLASITVETSDQWKTLDSARHWCEKYRPPTGSKMAA
ncbi:protein prenylyltransferase [Daldinia caldariorum]|uniref:protein prenylyltransferase n=1 Tax=Daldinia caldariorum TaxID=326644 RepID=UPI002007F1D5|nr:protein prenylyltransferase [Daldinia caldariorum]KAI1471173.1 protein prenylyltransferase [Daldinia caldariorum]